MVVRSLDLVNFRLHKNSGINFSDKLNYIIGGNGQGKTTILEAVYYLCTTKNLNQASDFEAVSFNEDYFELNGTFYEKTINKNRILYSLDNNRKNIFLDGKQVNRASEVIGIFPVVSLTLSDHAVTFGSPAERRKFIDSVISQSSKTYLKLLLDYNKTLRSRSSLLSAIKETRNTSLYSELDAWTESLIKLGSELVERRMKFLYRFNEYVKEAYNKIMGVKELPAVYYSFLGLTEPIGVAKAFEDELLARRDEELRRAANVAGPHRDDFIFSINDMELRKYGSQGQHKTFQIALRFAEFFFLKDILNRTPVFLMDDIFGELDSYRAKKISDFLKVIGQAFITMTDFGRIESLNINDDDLKIEVEGGNIAYV